MNTEISDRNPLTIKIGFWSASLIAAAFIIYTLCYIAIIIAFPIPSWTGIADYVASTDGVWFTLFTICQFLAFITPPLLVILFSSIYEYVAVNDKILVRAGSWFAIIFATMSSIHYFIQFTAVNHGISQGQLQGLEQFIQLNPSSSIVAINLLGWTVFFGLASLFIAPVFKKNRLEKAIRYTFLGNGICCILGSFGYIFNIFALNLLFFNGMGAAVIIVSILLSIFFKRLEYALQT